MNDDPSPLYELPPPAQLRFPDPFGNRYRVGNLVSDEGSFSRVHEATDVSHGGRLALKLPRSPSPQDLHRLRRTAKSHEILTDPRIARTRAAGQDQATGFIFAVEDFSPWISAHEWSLNGSGPDPRSVAFLIREVADAMERVSDSISRPGQKVYAVHRDIKPANIKVDCVIQDRRAGPIRAILIIDWLQSYFPDFPGTTEISANKVRFGTPGFWAPEVSLDLQPPDHQSDICSLAHTAFYLLRGHAPADGQDVPLLPKHYGPRSLRALLVDMGRAKRDRRIQSWAQVRDRADRIVRALDAPRSRAKILAAWAATAILLVAAVALWAHRFLAGRPAAAPDPTRTPAARGTAPPTDSHPLPLPADARSPFILPGTADWDEILRVHEVILEHRELLSALRFETVLLRLPELRSATATSWAQSLARAQEYIRGWYHELATVRSLHVVPLIDGTTVELWVERAEGDTVVGRTNTAEHHRIPATRIGASVFEDPLLDATDQLRAVSATRGPNAALALAARMREPPAEILYLLSAAYSAAGQELNGPSGVADTIDRELARPLPPRTARSPWPPFPGDPPRRLEPPRHQFAVENLAERLRATTAGFTEVSQAPWWETVERSSPDLMRMIRSLLGEARGWGLFLADQNDQLFQEVPQTEAAKRSARRLAHELAADARDLLQLREQLHYSGNEGTTFEIIERDRIVRGGQIRAATGDVALIPAQAARWAGTRYVGLKANFTRRDDFSCILAVLASGSVRIELSRDLRAIGLEPPFSTPLPVDPTEGEHVVELVFAGGKTAVLLDDHMAAILPVTYTDWPAVGVRHMDAEVKELREWATPPE